MLLAPAVLGAVIAGPAVDYAAIQPAAGWPSGAVFTGEAISLAVLMAFVVVFLGRLTLLRWTPAVLATGVAVLIFAGGMSSGGSFNPARQLGLLLFAERFSYLWAYLLGPLAGAVILAMLVNALGLPRPLTCDLCGTPPRKASPTFARPTRVGSTDGSTAPFRQEAQANGRIEPDLHRHAHRHPSGSRRRIGRLPDAQGRVLRSGEDTQGVEPDHLPPLIVRTDGIRAAPSEPLAWRQRGLSLAEARPSHAGPYLHGSLIWAAYRYTAGYSGEPSSSRSSVPLASGASTAALPAVASTIGIRRPWTNPGLGDRAVVQCLWEDGSRAGELAGEHRQPCLRRLTAADQGDRARCRLNGKIAGTGGQSRTSQHTSDLDSAR